MAFNIVVHECTDFFNIAFVGLKRHPGAPFIRLFSYFVVEMAFLHLLPRTIINTHIQHTNVIGLPDFSTVVPRMPSMTHDIICISVPYKVVQKYGEDWEVWLLKDLNKTTQKKM